MPALVDLRGTPDHTGRELDVDDRRARRPGRGGGGLVMGKAARVPAAVVRGLALGRRHGGAATDLVRAPARRPVPGVAAAGAARASHDPVVRTPARCRARSVDEAIAAACTAPAPHHTRPVALRRRSTAPRRSARCSAAIADAWRADLRATATPEDVDRAADRAERRGARRRADADRAVRPLRRRAPLPRRGARGGRARDVPAVGRRGDPEPAARAARAGRSRRCWISSTCSARRRRARSLGLDDGWYALGTVACGPMPEGGASRPRPPIDPSDVPALVRLGERAPRTKYPTKIDRHEVHQRVHVARPSPAAP